MEISDLKSTPSVSPKADQQSLPQPSTTIRPPDSFLLTHSRRVVLLTLASGLPAIFCTLLFLWFGDYTAKTQWTLTLLIVGCWVGFALAAQQRVIFPLQTLANLLSGLREGDFSIRARGARREDPLGELITEVNLLSDTLHRERLSALEATTLLRTVIAEIDVNVFSFDQNWRLRLINRAGERLMGQPAEKLIGRHAAELGLSECLAHDGAQTMALIFPGSTHSAGAVTRWDVRHSRFREQGVAQHLLVLSDLSRALREEERVAWQRLVRVLGHELNNSLTPIKSIAGSLNSLLLRYPRPGDWEADMQWGLEVISSRAEALNRFMTAYARLARLPKPEFQPVDVGALLQRVIELETRMPVALLSGPPAVIQADAGQLEQLLINLIRNAVEATLEVNGENVCVSWNKGRLLEIRIEDDGPGISATTNLFVPFFTTKTTGSGIGLVLSRQIAEAHHGSLTLTDNPQGPGCIARLTLPLE